MHARLNFPKSIITSFDVNNLKYMFESTDAAYKVLDQAKSKTNYWDDENNYFYQALYEIFQDVHTVEEKEIKMMMIKNRRERTVVQMMRVIMNKRVLVNKENLHCMESGQIKIFLTRHICLFCGIDFCMFSHVVSIVRYGKHVIIQKDLKQLSYKLFT